MKRLLTLLLILCFMTALIAGCSGSGQSNTGTTASTAAPTAAAPQTSPSTTDTGSAETPVVSTSPYNLAAGKYQLNSDGWPEKYEYTLPLSTTDEVFTQWTTSYAPQYLPENDYKGVAMYVGMEKMTGVHIEYHIASVSSMAENFAVLVNSDSLCDISAQVPYYWTSGTLKSGVEDGYFANLYDYKDYMPNYLNKIYNISLSSVDILGSVFYDDTTWVTMYSFYKKAAQGTGYMVRQDFMNKLNLGSATDIQTYEQFADVLRAMKVGITVENFYPVMIYSTLALVAGDWCGFDTVGNLSSLQYPRVVNGEVQFCGVTSDDYDLLSMLNGWWNEGLIDPRYSSYGSDRSNLTNAMYADQIGSAVMTYGTVYSDESLTVNPDCEWEPTKRMRKTTDQIIHYNFSGGWLGMGSATISAKCKNIPLVVSYLDWGYSDAGSDWITWGPEYDPSKEHGPMNGIWYYDDDGNRMLTDYAINHVAGTGWLQLTWLYNGFCESGISDISRGFAYPGGQRFLAMCNVWDEVYGYYDGAYILPTAATKFDDADNNTVVSSLTDATTYYQETSIMFITGDKPLTQWDDFVSQINNMGLGRVQEIYQKYYDAYIAA